jgi:energy-coupling factor transport system substrate-specific component
MKLVVRNDSVSRVFLVGVSVLAVALFAWPLLAGVVGIATNPAVAVAMVGVPLLVVLASLVAEGSVRSTTLLAVVGVLVALGATARIVSLGFAGIELVFIVMILAGRALGARLGFVIGVLSVALSSVVFGGFGPWTAFQMFAVGWVAAGAGLLPRFATPATPRSRNYEVVLLAAYGAVASYVFGLLMNLWFWPVAVGVGTTLSYSPEANVGENILSFLVFSLATSTLTWDTVRALVTVMGVAVVGKPALMALRRAYQRPKLPEK